MKKYIMLLISVFINFAIISAQDCKPKKVVTDDFTGITTSYYGTKLGQGRSIIFGFSYNVTTYVSVEEGKNTLSTILYYSQGLKDASVNDFTVPKGSIIRFKTTTGLITLTVDEVKSQKRRIGDNIGTTFIIESTLSDEDLKLLQVDLIEKYQITPTNKESISSKVTSSKAEKMQRQVLCFEKSRREATTPNKNLRPIASSSHSNSQKLVLEKGVSYLEGDFCLAKMGINARFEHFIGDNFTLGASLGYISKKESGYTQVQDGWYFDREDYEIRTSVTYITPFARYYWVAGQNYGVYSGLSLGYGKAAVKVLSGSYSIGAEVSGFVADFHSGIRYHINPKTSFVGELGYGLSLLRLGASITL